MSETCSTPSAPINISGNPISTCDLKCNFSYNYKNSTSTVTRNTDYLSLSYENSYPEPVKYNSNDYPVSEVRIYSPSIHKFSDNHTAAEMVILHNGSYGKLAVCIPLKMGGQEKSASTLDLAKILYTAEKYSRGNSNNSAVLQKPINLNNFIPQKKFYTYKGVFPFASCNSEYNCIVFSPLDDAFVYIPPVLLKLLKKLITPHTIDVGQGQGQETDYYVNEKGPINSSSTSSEDDIYIDCKPLGDDGNPVIGDDDRDVKEKISASNPFTGINIKNLFKNPLIILILAAVSFFIIMKSVGFLSAFIFANREKLQASL